MNFNYQSTCALLYTILPILVVPGGKVGSKAPDCGKKKAADSQQMPPLLFIHIVTVRLAPAF